MSITMELKHIQIPDKDKENFFRMYLFAFYNINKYIFLKMHLTVLFFATLSYCEVLSVNAELFILLLLAFFVLSASLSFEEVFHAAMMIIQERKEEVSSLAFNVVKARALSINAIGVSVMFKGKLSTNDILYLMMGGPICAVVSGSIIGTFVLCVGLLFDVPPAYLVVILICLIGAPCGALVPLDLKFATSDGYRVFQIATKYKINFRRLLVVIRDVVVFGYYYVRCSF